MFLQIANLIINHYILCNLMRTCFHPPTWSRSRELKCWMVSLIFTTRQREYWKNYLKIEHSSEGFDCNRTKFYWSLTFPSLSLDIECFDLAGAKIRQTRLVPFDSVSFRNLIMQIKLARRIACRAHFRVELTRFWNMTIQVRDTVTQSRWQDLQVSCNIGSED